MRLLWAQHSQEEDWGFLFIDERNTSNEEHRTAMFWDIWHEWTSGAQFNFTCYCHWDTLVVRNIDDGSGHLLYSK